MVSLDSEGFLRDLGDWDQQIAAKLAENEGIKLTPDHWDIIELVRNYYATYQVSPVTRVLVKITREKFGETKGHSIHLMKLFSGKPAKLVSKIAGLPKPANCD